MGAASHLHRCSFGSWGVLQTRHDHETEALLNKTLLAAWTMILSHWTRTTSKQQIVVLQHLQETYFLFRISMNMHHSRWIFGCAGRARLLLLRRESLVQQTDWLTPRLPRLPWRQLEPGMQTRLCCDSLSGLTPPEMAYPVAPWPRCRLQLCR